MKNLKRNLGLAVVMITSLSLFSFKSSNHSMENVGDSKIVYQSNHASDSDEFYAAIKFYKLAKKVYNNDCRLAAYAVADFVTSIFDTEDSSYANYNDKEQNFKLNQL